MGTISVLQWNVLFKEDIERVARLIKEVNPDIVCVQEVNLNSPFNKHKDTIVYLARKLGYNCIYAPARAFIEGNVDGNAVLSRYPMLSTKCCALENPISEHNKEGCSYAEATIEIGKKRISVGTTHLSFYPGFRINDRNRQELGVLLKHIRKKKYIFTGDLNATPNSAVVKELTKTLKNAGPPYGQSTWTTRPFSYMGFKENKLRWRLDYVFASKDVKIKSARIIKTKYSDHLPILVEIEI